MSKERDRASMAADDEALSALIDGELSGDSAAALRRRLAEEPALAQRYQVLSGVDGALRNAVDRLDDGEIPDRVLELLREPLRAPGDATEAKNSQGAQRRGAVTPLRRWHRFTEMPVAIAAGLALVVGVLVGQQIAAPAADLPLSALAGLERIEAGSSLHRVLHTVPSNETVALAGGVDVTPRLSFARSGGGHCRLLEIAGPDALARSVACHGDAGWHMALAEFAPLAPDVADAPYRPAAAPGGAIERALDALIDGAPLGPEQEHALIQRNWRD